MVDVGPSVPVAMRRSFMVPEIRPLDQYDGSRAKVAASVSWLLSCSYGSPEHVPEELREPFYTDQYEQEHIKPPVIRLLLNTDIYCSVCSKILPKEEGGSLRDNNAVLQVLSRQGLQPTEQDKPVTDTDLRQKPIKMNAHLAVIDSLMTIRMMEMTSAMTASSDKLLSPSPSSPSLGTLEHNILSWVSKINQTLRDFTEREHQLRQQHNKADIQSQQSCPTRWYWKLVPHAIAFCLKESGNKPPVIRYRKDKLPPKQTPSFPEVSSLKDLANGCALASVIHYYCPDIIRLEDVCLKETMSVADSLYNLQMIQEFTSEYLENCCHLALEDLLYSPLILKVNILSFVAEVFWWFEELKPDFVHPKDPLTLEDVARMSEENSPTSASSTSSPAFTFRHPFLSGVQPLSPVRGSPRSPGSMQHSTSLTHDDGFGRTWPKKQLKPLSQAVSLSIPFGLDSDIDIVMGNPILRSVSTDSLTPNVYQGPKNMTRTAYSPPEDLTELLDKGSKLNSPNGIVTSPRILKHPLLPSRSGGNGKESGGVHVENGMVGDRNSYTEPPTIEQALQIIHSSDRLLPEGAPDEFYLHSPETADGYSKPRMLEQSPFDSHPQNRSIDSPKGLGIYRVHSEPTNGCHKSLETSHLSRDDDSVLRDNSLDSDAEDASKLPHDKDATSRDDCTSCLSSISSQAESVSSSSGVKMTSFAERKKKMAPPDNKSSSSSSQKTTPDSSELNAPQMATWAQKSEDSPSKSPTLNTEMSQLGTRLEEKRRAIEAQKKRIEAIFTKHRQRLGKSAFLQLKKKDDGSDPEGDSGTENKSLTLEERLSKIEDDEEIHSPSPVGNRESGTKEPSDFREVPGKSKSEKQVTFSPEITRGDSPDNLGEYNKAVAKLNSALSSLQMDMQRLAEQQQKLMNKEKSKAWVIPVPKPVPQRPSRESQISRAVEASLSPSPSPSRKSATSCPKSPQPVHKRPSSTPQKSPKHTRPAELKVPPLTRVLTPPQNVDTIPHLRKFSPSQVPVQTKSSVYLTDNDNFGYGLGDKFRQSGLSDKTASESEESSEAGSHESHTELENDDNIRPAGLSIPRKETVGSLLSSDTANSDSQKHNPEEQNVKRINLIEIPLSQLQVPDEGTDDLEHSRESLVDQSDPEQKTGVGFFFKNEEKAEEEMAIKKAALLERQQKRAEEAKKRKQWQEAEKEQKEETSLRLPSEVEKPKPEEKPKEEEVSRRGCFTREEYERRQQLKIMADLDKVLRQKPTTVRAVKKARPKSEFRDDSVISRSPAKNHLGSRLNKTYSQSTTSLSSMANDSGNTLSVKKSSRPNSPSRLLSPSRQLFTQNGEDWENASTASSPASIPENTGRKWCKEPSAKSNKCIIQNALSHCCLAGKVNEPQKNKILEEMEKSKANHFLILFRDNSCQFRAIYTFSPEFEEMIRIAGYGPKTITQNMIEGIYKYNSDRKQFTMIPSKTLSANVDAFVIQGQLWQTKKPGATKRPGTPK
ncbi:calmodulin-regulated spectrin-associated protein 3 [Protopterus annectens]|uniref:calmodulin-regulated spectrin-associated protein 3 n=1 Tax=Protopterus annectens TaxID=7888 RepID=UPI001CFA3BF3|nr:calmodulin-regulated spectrin-associated protein 3 [Protopterus annectens]